MKLKFLLPNKFLTKQLKISFIVMLFLMVSYSLLRAGFYLNNMSSFVNSSLGEIFLSFLKGLRFDIAAILITNSPMLLLYNLPYAPVNKKWYKILILVLFFAVNLTAIFTNIADYGYFETTQRRLMYELYTMSGDIARMIPSSIKFHYVLFIIFLAGGAIFVYLFLILAGRLDKKIVLNRRILTEVITLILISFISVIGIRGGLQLKPLRQANAFSSDNQALGYLTLNTTYNVVRSMFQPLLPDISRIPKPEADRIVLNMLKDTNESVLDSQYIFMRKKSFGSEPRKLNVVIFIMESWSAKYSGSITGGKTITPFFDSLSQKGLLFTNFFANGQRSIEAIPSILTSVPSIYNASIIGSIAEMDKYRGLGSILKEQGYTTSFHHGASIGSMGFDGFSKIAGFTDYYGKEDFLSLPSSAFDGSWGIFDEPFFLESEKIISNYQQPFCSVIYSLSSHEPYKIPDERAFFIEQFKDETDFEKSMRYSDFCLQKFFETASSKPWFANTMFIITADHTLYYTRDNFYSCFHTPLLFYTPAGIVAPGRDSSIASHTDIIPSVLDLLHIPAVHSSMGLSVFSAKQERYCFEKYGNDYCIIGNQYALLNDLENIPRLYLFKTDPSLKDNIAGKHPEIVSDMNTKLLSYIEATTFAIAKNKIYK